MNKPVWIVLLLLLGLATGKMVGALRRSRELKGLAPMRLQGEHPLDPHESSLAPSLPAELIDNRADRYLCRH
jgi:hypothetical protein